MVEKLSFFESAILKKKSKKKKIASNLFKLIKVYGIPRMGRNFDDYRMGGYKIMRYTVSSYIQQEIDLTQIKDKICKKHFFSQFQDSFE